MLVNVKQPLQVAVVSRYPLIRAGIATLIHLCPDRAIVVDASADDGHLADQDVAVFDLAGLAERHDSDLPHILTGQMPVVALAREGRPDLTQRAHALGVTIVVPEDVTPERLLDALEDAVATSPLKPRSRSISVRLTGREAEILHLVATGLTNQQIAGQLRLSPNTVKTHVRTAYKRIGARSRAQAAVWAVQHGLRPGQDDRQVPAGH
jgi:DNA-binding NarL/FixJ family response regulator